MIEDFSSDIIFLPVICIDSLFMRLSLDNSTRLFWSRFKLEDLECIGQVHLFHHTEMLPHRISADNLELSWTVFWRPFCYAIETML